MILIPGFDRREFLQHMRLRVGNMLFPGTGQFDVLSISIMTSDRNRCNAGCLF